MTDTPTERAAEGTWTRLRRRKVVQWGVAYAAGAWGLLQGLECVTDTFHWPDQIQQLAMLALLVGLPMDLRAEVRRVPGADHQAHGGESRNALSRLVANEVVVLEPTRRVSTGCAEEGPN